MSDTLSWHLKRGGAGVLLQVDRTDGRGYQVAVEDRQDAKCWLAFLSARLQGPFDQPNHTKTYDPQEISMADKEFAPLNSSMLEGVHYDPDTRVLTAKYRNGATYTHHDIPAEKHAALMEAASPGSYFNAKIRDNHPGKKVD